MKGKRLTALLAATLALAAVGAGTAAAHGGFWFNHHDNQSGRSLPPCTTATPRT